MTKIERMRAALAGRTTDRMPRALWRHFPLTEYNREAFVEETVRFYAHPGLDVAKIGPRSSFGIRDYGVRDIFEDDYLGRPRYLNQVIRDHDGWARLPRLDPKAGWLGHTADCVRAICQQSPKDTPKVLTIFSPATQAKNLVGSEQLQKHWRDHPEALRVGLNTLAENTRALVQALADVKLDGLFYAIQECGLNDLKPSYHAMCGDLDAAILTSGEFWLNMLHLHGCIEDFGRYARYPVHVLHWDELASGITLAAGRKHFPGMVSGGLDWPSQGWCRKTDIQAAATSAVTRAGPGPLLLSAGCVIPWQTPAEQIDAFGAFI